MVLERNQHVAACVPYTKRKQEWIVAKIERWEENNNCYIVRDLYPDKRKKVHSWEVPPENVIRFPSLDSDVFTPGNRVLSLWKVDNEEWSSMFYRATVVEVLAKEDGDKILRVCFDGDSEVYEVPRCKAIKFEKRSTRAAQSRNGATEKVSGKVRKSPSEPLEEPAGKRVKGSDDSCTTEESDLAENFSHHDGIGEFQQYRGGCSVLDKKMRNYRAILVERYNTAHQATLLNVS